MHPNASYYDGPPVQGLDQQARLDRQHEEDMAFQARYESERHDRAMVRRELERGVSDAEIEEQLAIASEFVRLNPGRDVRGLIDEEKSGFQTLSGEEPLRDGLPPTARPTSPPAPAANPRAAEAEAQAQVRDYVNENFKSDDWLAVLAINRKSSETVQRVSPAGRIVSPEYQRWLRYLNTTGSDVYMSLNTFKERARGRTKEDLKEIRHLYLDLDEGGAQKLEAIRHDNAVPAPNYVLNTSPGKFQVIWRVEGIGQDQAEAMLRTLAQRFGGDPAATDSTRVFRLPGFSNKKYPEDFQVTMSRGAPASQVYNAQDFKIHEQDRARPQQALGSPRQERPLTGEPESQSEKDWRYALRKLKAGEDPEQIIRDMASYRGKDRYDKNDQTKLIAPAKPRPYYYAEQTVTKAMAHLGMTKRPAPDGKVGASSRESETAPSR